MTAPTDRELLELAARAADYEINFEEPVNDWYPHGYDDDGDVDKWWNPLTDDGDAFRLAVKLSIKFGQRDELTAAAWAVPTNMVEVMHCGADQLPATRRAIVLVAADIGKAMP